ncbi:class I SAM-dependent methyltransferase [Microcoleus sp. FACHB-SPT15]|uniref:class I SAM-dependent methyltransferase n=1 Tax=Microcoleus sp. FACHB-SPT15 TaxID=2692830 RepID=UPI00178538B1|nr:class I SAM-dependent methyltransferase [Microcoleus sp. FACHB-SPT15]MBD1803891.1 class I SAM-dependent methyltransferase [Microcoleus sp. FACHB-SPT15]
MKTQNQANHYKWLIPSGRLAPEPELWEEHEDYKANVFSLTCDPSLCETLIAGIPDSSKTRILIPGCGSLIELQKKLLEACPNIGQVCCTDFSSKAIERAEASWLQYAVQSNLSSNPVSFEKLDSTQLTELKPDWRNQFDYVLVVNSVLSSKDKDNRKMLGEFYKALKPGGKLYGLFPTVFCGLEIAYLIKDKAHWLIDGNINLSYSAFYEEKQNRHQIFYTPLRLNRIFKETGFKRLNFEVYFCDSKYFNTKDIYGYDEPDICVWEFLVRLEKEKTQYG